MYRTVIYNAEGTEIVATDEGGRVVFIPVDSSNKDYLLLVNGDTETGTLPTPILAYTAPVVTRKRSRIKALEVALIKKGSITKQEVDAEV